MSEWFEWAKVKPASGSKIMILCSDGCSSAPALVVDVQDGGIDVLHGEDGESLSGLFMDGAMWCNLPETYALRFTEITDADWY